ncbi:hypothetical protein E4U54_008544 [Claviceps lovelessii]|nr:hypothetical protein E4U54_008544 [Claviceps lovelessii]
MEFHVRLTASKIEPGPAWSGLVGPSASGAAADVNVGSIDQYLAAVSSSSDQRPLARPQRKATITSRELA